MCVLARREEVAQAINEQHRNPRYLTEFVLPDNLTSTTDVAAALAGAAYIVHSVPVQATEDFLKVTTVRV